jgi:hypothetical protein
MSFDSASAIFFSIAARDFSASCAFLSSRSASFIFVRAVATLFVLPASARAFAAF